MIPNDTEILFLQSVQYGHKAIECRVSENAALQVYIPGSERRWKVKEGKGRKLLEGET